MNNKNEYLERLLQSVRDSYTYDEAEADGSRENDGQETPESIPEEDFVPIERIFERLSRKLQDQKEAESCKQKKDIWSELIDLVPLGWFMQELTVPVEVPESKPGSLRKKILPTATALLMSVLLLCVVAYYILCADGLRAMMSVKQLEVSANAYSMSYNGNYGFNDFLRQGGASSDEELMAYLTEQFSGGLIEMPKLAGTGATCIDSTLTARDSVSRSGVLTGHSFHSSEELMSMVVTTWSVNGIETVSTTNLNWLGYTPYSPPDLFNRYATLASLYLPLSGMNRHGLAVVALEVSDSPAPVNDTGRPDLTATTAVRMLLDKAAYADEAVDMLAKFDVFPSCGREYHLAVSDSEGRSVVMEWVDGKMIVAQSPCAANGYLSGSGIGDDRINALFGAHRKYGGHMTAAQVIDAMQWVSPEGDGWVALYDIGECSASFSFDGDYGKQFAVCMN